MLPDTAIIYSASGPKIDRVIFPNVQCKEEAQRKKWKTHFFLSAK